MKKKGGSLRCHQHSQISVGGIAQIVTHQNTFKKSLSTNVPARMHAQHILSEKRTYLR